MQPKAAREKGWKKVGEVAKLLGTTPRALLYYEEQGIISPRRTSRGTRYYTKADIRRFAMAHRMVALGIPVKTVRELATIRPAARSGRESSRRLAPAIEEIIEDLDRRIDELSRLREDLARGSEIIRACFDCDLRPTRLTCPECPCETRLYDAEVLALTWDPDRDE
ncbi:MAG: MerR family transcriptional regulator [Gammaproteobacteria bacterium]|nr:MerR family transcriptional regulator [Gammaproteobacteria bacterium]